jgi:(2Fe-2S) ferredoxin
MKGQKYAGNVIIYPQGHWYGRVRTCHVPILVEQHLLGGKIVRDLWRGCMTQGTTTATSKEVQPPAE